MKKKELLMKMINIAILIILIPILFVSTVILINSCIHPDEIPSFFGWKPFIVLSGSMESEIYPGDVVVVKEVKTEELKEGEIIAFKNGKIVVTHRIIKIEEEKGQTKFITKGDNNNTADNGYVLPQQVEGKYQFRIGRLGNVAMFIQTPTGMVACLSIPFLLLILLEMSNSNRGEIQEKVNREKEMEEEIQRLKKQNEELMKNK